MAPAGWRRATETGAKARHAIDTHIDPEHGLILEQLENLGLARQRLEEGLWPPEEFFAEALGFAREFADRLHHFKEAFLLFGLLAQKKQGRLDADIGALRYQHERCRKALAEIEQALPGCGSQDEFAATALALGLAGHVTLLRRHVFLEENVFFPLAASVLTAADDAELCRHFAAEAHNPDFMEQSRRQVAEMGVMLRGAPAR